MDWINVSAHAADRWHQRTDSPGIGPIVAWNEGDRTNVRTIEGDELRYHRDTETILVRKEQVLVTVIDAATARPAIQRSIYGRVKPSA